MRILVADTLPPGPLQALADAGHDCIVEPGLGTGDLVGHLDGVEILVVRSTVVDAAAIDAGADLGLVVRAGAGTNTIDVARAAERGVYVCNIPGRNSVAVAELTMGLLLAVDRHIADATADLRAGRWDKSAHSRADGLLGSTMGIVGLGSIGLAVAERAVAFGIEVVAIGKRRSAATDARLDALGVVRTADLGELVVGSDIVSLHVPGADSTRHLVDARFLALMRPGAILLNTCRGDVVDEAALIEAMDSRGIRAGLDVFADEPGSGRAPFESPLARHPNVVGTHHIGASTAQAQAAVADGVVEVIDAYRRGEVVNVVNLADEVAGASALTVRHLDRVGVLAAVLAVLREQGLNVETMRNRVLAGAVAAVAQIDLSGPLPDDALAAIRAHPDVLSVACRRPAGEDGDGAGVSGR